MAGGDFMLLMFGSMTLSMSFIISSNAKLLRELTYISEKQLIKQRQLDAICIKIIMVKCFTVLPVY